MTIWFTSDTHWHHKNIINLSNRPWDTVEEMNAGLIDNWNAVVQPKDEVYHLGDFGFCGSTQADKILRRLNGRKFFLRGNHDDGIKGVAAEHFEWIKDLHEFKHYGQRIVLMHYPMECWNHSCRGSWHLHGHTHKNLVTSKKIRRWDVGVDTNNYFPVSFEQIKTIMEDEERSSRTNDCNY